MTGSQSQLQALTCFLINDSLAIDAGSLGLALTPREMRQVRDVLITHTHSDHTASLPIFIAEAFVEMVNPVTVYGTAEVISVLREFVFNDRVWPDFEQIDLASGNGPALEFRPLEPRKTVEIAGLRITPVPVNHIVPTVGLVIADDRTSIVITSDTYTTDEIWRVASETENLKAVFVDVSYPNELEHLAAAARHLTPRSLKDDLAKLDPRNSKDVEIYAVHIKPTNRDLVLEQLAGLDNPSVLVAEVDRTYEW
jgi:cAMP phosphodiesterase